MFIIIESFEVIITMHLNENIKIIGKKVILVPYKRKHVDKYHKWMQSKELQELTASMPLSLEEEYAMQASWVEDEDKCTFLVLDRHKYEEDNSRNEIDALVGDTNLFLCQDMDSAEEQPTNTVKCAEVEIMIAEPSARGKGFGWEAMLLMLKYGQEKLAIDRFMAKIGMDNERSLRMFNKMHFCQQSQSLVFHENTLSCAVTSQWIKWLDELVTLELAPYEEDKQIKN